VNARCKNGRTALIAACGSAAVLTAVDPIAVSMPVLTRRRWTMPETHARSEAMTTSQEDLLISAHLSLPRRPSLILHSTIRRMLKECGTSQPLPKPRERAALSRLLAERNQAPRTGLAESTRSYLAWTFEVKLRAILILDLCGFHADGQAGTGIQFISWTMIHQMEEGGTPAVRGQRRRGAQAGGPTTFTAILPDSSRCAEGAIDIFRSFGR
jgi:hypothetical protein